MSARWPNERDRIRAAEASMNRIGSRVAGPPSPTPTCRVCGVSTERGERGGVCGICYEGRLAEARARGRCVECNAAIGGGTHCGVCWNEVQRERAREETRALPARCTDCGRRVAPLLAYCTECGKARLAARRALRSGPDDPALYGSGRYQYASGEALARLGMSDNDIIVRGNGEKPAPAPPKVDTTPKKRQYRLNDDA